LNASARLAAFMEAGDRRNARTRLNSRFIPAELGDF
jgi:hypothetical protein